MNRQASHHSQRMRPLAFVVAALLSAVAILAVVRSLQTFQARAASNAVELAEIAPSSRSSAADRFRLAFVVPGLQGELTRPPIGKEPHLDTISTVIDLGEIYEGRIVRTVVPFRNLGPGPLHILHQFVSCDCTLTSLEINGEPYVTREPIAAGASGRLVLELRTSGYSGDQVSQVRLVTNDPSLPAEPPLPFGVLKITLRATVRRFFEFERSRNHLLLASVTSKTRAEERFILASSNGDSFSIARIEPEDARVRFRWAALDDTRSRWAIDVAAGPDLPLGLFSREYSVATDVDVTPPKLYVTGRVRGSIEMTPPEGFQFGPVRREEPRELSVALDSADGSLKSLELGSLRLVKPYGTSQSTEDDPREGLAVERLADQFQFSVQRAPASSSDATRWMIRCRTKTTIPLGACFFIVEVATGVPDGPERIRLPLSAVVH